MDNRERVTHLIDGLRDLEVRVIGNAVLLKRIYQGKTIAATLEPRWRLLDALLTPEEKLAVANGPGYTAHDLTCPPDRTPAGYHTPTEQEDRHDDLGASHPARGTFPPDEDSLEARTAAGACLREDD
jgi:hypothetical protein